MKTIDYIRMNLETGYSMVAGLLDDMKDAPLTQPTSQGGNHPLWILGHLAYSEANILHNIMQGNENPLADWSDMFAGGTEPVADADRYVSWDEAWQKFQDIRKESLAYLDTLTDADLDQPSKNCTPGRESFFGTIGQCFNVMALHPTMHYGQIADARRAAGRARLFV